MSKNKPNPDLLRQVRQKYLPHQTDELAILATQLMEELAAAAYEIQQLNDRMNARAARLANGGPSDGHNRAN